MERVAISKTLRFEIFKRDSFKCRYCGRTPEDGITLQVDHLIPVCEGGTNDEANLVTACFDCNSGKKGRLLDAPCPTETDWLAVLQERREILQQAEMARDAAAARDEFRQEVCNYWCEMMGVKDMQKSTLNMLVSFVHQHGAALVYEWIQIASQRVPHLKEYRQAKYICGIRRNLIGEDES